MLWKYREKTFRDCLKSRDKWTKPELDAYVKPFIDLNQNFDAYLMKNTKIIKETNPFDPTKDIAYCLLRSSEKRADFKDFDHLFNSYVFMMICLVITCKF